MKQINTRHEIPKEVINKLKTQFRRIKVELVLDEPDGLEGFEIDIETGKNETLTLRNPETGKYDKVPSKYIDRYRIFGYHDNSRKTFYIHKAEVQKNIQMI